MRHRAPAYQVSQDNTRRYQRRMTSHLISVIRLTILRQVNVLVTSCQRACLADFGLSNPAVSRASDSSEFPGGTHQWMAPELFNIDVDSRGAHNNPETDIYSFGCLCYEVSRTIHRTSKLISHIERHRSSLEIYLLVKQETTKLLLMLRVENDPVALRVKHAK